ncbi:hypothetical protein POTG_04415 [Paenibacillus sp. oral taxon 786 str. D14]|uniref:hypothetical protein n=1 Tax=unclassified Paenibacillus TaxID=185978 RepID=UPI0001AFD68D|nr:MULTISPECIES: hypothetical protein [unclassified Paenibacillus]EES70972.1 hypothetical protein POTG_04415 [Paenibacillus sp. oral taxon 786 str. D14]MCT2197535.1 hypothetical protein [Paenibacillus sp. p3-SID1389]
MDKEQNTLPSGEGSGVDPIPVPKHPTSATEKLEDFVGEMMEEWTETFTGEAEEKNQSKDQAK